MLRGSIFIRFRPVGSHDGLCCVSIRTLAQIHCIGSSTAIYGFAAEFFVSLTLFHCPYSYMGPAEVAAWGLIGYLWYAFEVLTGTCILVLFVFMWTSFTNF